MQHYHTADGREVSAHRDAKSGQKTLSIRVNQLLQEQNRGLPIWIRAPKNGAEYYSGLSRSKLYEGAGKGHFRSVSIREPGQIKGTRLFHLQSLLDFIERCEETVPTTKATIGGKA